MMTMMSATAACLSQNHQRTGTDHRGIPTRTPAGDPGKSCCSSLTDCFGSFDRGTDHQTSYWRLPSAVLLYGQQRCECYCHLRYRRFFWLRCQRGLQTGLKTR
uniref:Uncharacterized protein n=1 Tax=Rhizophora mucronata TaxID=61149 RepID=A0A2P2PQ10_RHIMU